MFLNNYYDDYTTAYPINQQGHLLDCGQTHAWLTDT